MGMDIPCSRSSQNDYIWYQLYLDALSETDPVRMRLRISEAEGVLQARQRALYGSRDNLQERQSLAATLLALRALRICLRSLDLHVDAA